MPLRTSAFGLHCRLQHSLLCQAACTQAQSPLRPLARSAHHPSLLALRFVGTMSGPFGSDEAIPLTPTQHVVFQLDSDEERDTGAPTVTPAAPRSNPMPGASAGSAARAQTKRKGKGPALTASQLYGQMVQRNELAQISLDQLHRTQNQGSVVADAPLSRGHSDSPYAARTEPESEDEIGLLDQELGPRTRVRIHNQPWSEAAHQAATEWLGTCRERLQQNKKGVRVAFWVILNSSGLLLIALALYHSKASTLVPTWWSGGQDVDTKNGPVGTTPEASQGEGDGLLDLRPNEAGTWYKSLPGAMATGSLPFWASQAALPTGASQTRGKHVIQTAVAGDKEVQDLSPFEHMGPLSPYSSADGFGVDNLRYRDLSALMPDETGRGTCSIDQVHILHRHGSRYPTSGSPARTVTKLADARDKGQVSFSGPLAFLQSWKYQLGSELLTPPGRLQLYHSGVQAHMQYGQLIGEQFAGAPAAAPDLPPEKPLRQARKRQFNWGTSAQGAVVVRAGSQRRIVDSALAWLQGFYGPQLWDDFAFPPEADLAAPRAKALSRGLQPRGPGGPGHKARIDIQIHPEGMGWNTTLASNFACPAANRGNATTAANLRTFMEASLRQAVERLQPYIQIQAPPQPSDSEDWNGKLTPSLVNAMQQLCSYETTAFGQSPFCSLFTAQEWRDYEHLWDMQFHGYDGAGTPLGAAQGIGWINEFIARLTAQPWDEATQSSENRTVNSDPARFPTGPDQRVFADFTHDSVLTAVLAALGATELNSLRPAQDSKHKALFRTSQLVPFAARMVFERLSCGTKDHPVPYVRMILNDAVVPLADIGCKERSDGICPLDQFLSALRDRNRRANYHHVCGAWNP